MKVKEVKVLRAHNNSDLERQMNELLNKGWIMTDVLSIDKDHNIYTIMKK